MNNEMSREAQTWEERYRQQTTRWDIGEAAPPFVDYLVEPDALQTGKILVPGCGRGNDALFFARQGFEVIGVDFAPPVIQICQQRATSENLGMVRFEQQDVFNLGRLYPQTFDHIAEHTCFCAFDQTRRHEYAEVIRQVLRPGGILLTIFFTHRRTGGPPFTTSEPEIREFFEPYFEIQRLEIPKRSHPSRPKGEERFAIMKLR